jgi:hypothetical protein
MRPCLTATRQVSIDRGPVKPSCGILLDAQRRATEHIDVQIIDEWLLATHSREKHISSNTFDERRD